MDEFLWMLVILGAVCLPLVIGAVFVEELAPRGRKWIRRVERNKRGRLAQQARWIAGGCYYGPKRDPLKGAE